MSRHKHPLCESICPKQIFLSNFPKEISFGQSYYMCVLVQLFPPSSFSTHWPIRAPFALWEYYNSTSFTEIGSYAKGDEERDTDAKFYFQTFNSFPCQNPLSYTSIWKACTPIAQGQQAHKAGLRAAGKLLARSRSNMPTALPAHHSLTNAHITLNFPGVPFSTT